MTNENIFSISVLLVIVILVLLAVLLRRPRRRIKMKTLALKYGLDYKNDSGPLVQFIGTHKFNYMDGILNGHKVIIYDVEKPIYAGEFSYSGCHTEINFDNNIYKIMGSFGGNFFNIKKVEAKINELLK